VVGLPHFAHSGVVGVGVGAGDGGAPQLGADGWAAVGATVAGAAAWTGGVTAAGAGTGAAWTGGVAAAGAIAGAGWAGGAIHGEEGEGEVSVGGAEDTDGAAAIGAAAG
jgi:hypothetical protein